MIEDKHLPSKEMYFQGKRAMVTGGARGIGAAVASALAGLGAEVTVVDVLDGEGVDRIFYGVDVADKEGLSSVAHDLKEVDLLVIAAGVTSETNEPTSRERELMRAVNVEGVRNTLTAFSEALVEGAQVVYMGSDDPPKDYYAATKREGAELVKEFAQKRPDVDVRVLLLGPVRTTLFETGKSPQVIGRIERDVGLYEPEELANDVISLLLVKNERRLEERVLYWAIEE